MVSFRTLVLGIHTQRHRSRQIRSSKAHHLHYLATRCDVSHFRLGPVQRSPGVLPTNPTIRAQLLQDPCQEKAGALVLGFGGSSVVLVVWSLWAELAVPVVSCWSPFLGSGHHDWGVLHRHLGSTHGHSHQ